MLQEKKTKTTEIDLQIRKSSIMNQLRNHSKRVYFEVNNIKILKV